MKVQVKIGNIKSVNKLLGYWSESDLIAILDSLDYPDAESADPSELNELIAMAVTDFKPDEVAEKILEYKLGSILRTGQIENLAHEMLEDKIAEEYPDISLHYDLFNINQLLYHAHNGVFPNTLATVIELELSLQDSSVEITKEVMIKAIIECLSDQNPLVRLFGDQIKSDQTFAEAESILWQMHVLGNNKYRIVTSNYWISSEDVIQTEYKTSISLSEIEI